MSADVPHERQLFEPVDERMTSGGLRPLIAVQCFEVDDQAEVVRDGPLIRCPRPREEQRQVGEVEYVDQHPEGHVTTVLLEMVPDRVRPSGDSVDAPVRPLEPRSVIEAGPETTRVLIRHGSFPAQRISQPSSNRHLDHAETVVDPSAQNAIELVESDDL
nr:hypothetical protein [Rathayibacter sp. VKM Ac-2754]